MNINNKLIKKLLWKNPNPNNLIVGGTAISIDLAGFDYLMVVWKRHTNQTVTYVSKFFIGSGNTIELECQATNSSKGWIRSREIALVNSNNIYLYDGYIQHIGNARSVENGACIPVEIYGMYF